MSRTIFYDDDNRPRLVQSYCVFADFLGFSQEIKDAVDNGNEEAVFQKFMLEVETQISHLILPDSDDGDDKYPRIWDAKVFTDNVILGYALWSDRKEKEFGYIISQLLEFQYAVALKGYFLRGGWAIGNLFMNRNTVFGAALIDAHDLESKIAIYPRIVLSKDMKDLMYRHMARYAEDSPQSYHLLTDDKGIVFTHYLTEAIQDGEVQWHELRRHAELISERLAKYKADEKVCLKYQWLAAYHNFFCSQVSTGEGYSDDCRVSIEVPDVGIRIIEHEDSPYVIEARKSWIDVENQLLKAKRRNHGEQ